MPVTRAQVAQRAGVSPAVVSYVLNPGMRPVATETRRRVLAAIEELGYRPNAIAQALRSGPTQSIGLLVPDLTNPFFAEISDVVEDLAYQRGYVVLVGNTEGDPTREARYLNSFADRRVDGLIMITTSAPNLVEAAAESGTHVVLLDRVPHGSDVISVASDNLGGARLAVQHLLSLGHQRVAMIAGPKGMRVADERIRGWAEALREAHIEPTGSDVVHTPFSRRGGAQAATAILADRSITAVVCSSDVQAIGLIAECQRKGVQVPNNLSVVSFDGTDLAAFCVPPLTVIEQPLTQLATVAMDCLFDLVDHGFTSSTSHVIPTNLIIRASTAAPASR